MGNNTLSRAELGAEGSVLNIHYGDVLIKYGDTLDCDNATIPFVSPGASIGRKVDYLHDGDCIIADTAEDETVGKATEIHNIGERKIVAGLHTIPCRPLSEYASGFLGYYLNSSAYRSQLLPLMQGIKVLSLSKTNISATIICRPTVQEQTKIATFLSHLDKSITAQRKLIASLKSYKRGLLRAVFNREMRIGNLSQTAKQWQQVPFGEVFSFLPSNTLSRADLNYGSGSIKNIHYGDVLIKFGSWVDVNSADVPFINENCVTPRIKGSPLKNGDLVIADTAEDLSAGKATEVAGISGTDTVAGLHTIACRPNREFAPKFLGYYINSEAFHNQLLPLIQGTKVSSISRDALLNTTLDIPSITEQTAIAKMLVSFDRKLEILESNLKKLCDFKAGLLQSLFV